VLHFEFPLIFDLVEDEIKTVVIKSEAQSERQAFASGTTTLCTVWKMPGG
jgi:hypothetical protein